MGSQHSSLSQGPLDHGSDSSNIYMSAGMHSAHAPAVSEGGDATKDGSLRQVLALQMHASLSGSCRSSMIRGDGTRDRA